VNLSLCKQAGQCAKSYARRSGRLCGQSGGGSQYWSTYVTAGGVAATAETTLIGRISDVVRSGRGSNFVA